MKNRIEGKVVAITGASSGICKATAELLASQGAKVILAARRTERLTDIVNSIKDNGAEAAYLAVDVTQRSDLDKLTQFSIDCFGKLDISAT